MQTRQPQRRRRRILLRTGLLVERARSILDDLDYAQRRLLELQTGVILTPETARRHTCNEIAQLEALYELEY